MNSSTQFLEIIIKMIDLLLANTTCPELRMKLEAIGCYTYDLLHANED